MLIATPVLGWLLLAGVAAAIVAMHRLRPPANARTTSSTLLWQAAARRAGVLRSPWRWWLGLLLSLAAGATLTALLFRPGLQGAAAGTERIVLLLDVSPTMGTRTRDGRTRWAHAVDAALDVIRDAPGPVLVLDTGGTLPSGTFLAGRDAEARVLSLRPSPVRSGAVSALPAMAGLRVHVVSDGVDRFDLPAGAVVHSVYEPADNVAVMRVAVGASPVDPLRVDALVQVFNGSVAEKNVRVSLRGAEGATVRQSLRIAAGERIDATFDVSAFGAGPLAADVRTEGDALALDDVAYAVVPEHRPRRILLVGVRDDALADSLRSLPGVRVVSAAARDGRGGGDADLLVYEGSAPHEPPEVPALLFRPPPVPWLPAADVRTGRIRAEGKLPGDPLSDDVPWNGLEIRRALAWNRLPEGTLAFAGGREGALVVAGRARAPWIAAGFLPAESTLVFEPALPVFLGHAVARLTDASAPMSGSLGAVSVPLSNARITDGSGQPVTARPVPGATLFDALRPDIYTARSGEVRLPVVVSSTDESFSDVNRTRFRETDRQVEPGGAGAREPWQVLLLFVIGVLVLDWFLHTRRITR